MHLLIVPQKLANGKISTQALKPVQVLFGDGANENSTQMPMNKSSGKKVTQHSLLFNIILANLYPRVRCHIQQ
jgi:hypothetical protein